MAGAARPRRARRGAVAPSRREAAALVGDGGGRGRAAARLPLRRPEPRAHRGATVDDFPAEHRRRNGFARPDAPVEVVAIRARRRGPIAGHGRRARRPSTAPPSPVPRSWPSPTARPGSRTAGAPNRAPPARGSSVGRVDERARPGGAAGARLAPRRRRRRDGRGAAACRVQPQHQGARRLLGGGVHRRRASSSRRPSTSRCTSARCRRRSAPPSRSCGDTIRPGDAGRAERPVRRRHPPQRRHARRALLRRTGRSSAWVANRAHHADLGGTTPGFDAARRAR